MFKISMNFLVTMLVLAVSLPILAATDLDPTFQGGRIFSPISAVTNGTSGGNSIVIQPNDGKILVAGYGTSFNSLGNFKGAGLRRFNTDGTIDTAFGNSGTVVSFSNGSANFANYSNGMALQADGKIIVVGYIDSNNIGTANFADVIRFNTNATLDTTFGSGGQNNSNFGGSAIFNDVAIQSDGKIVAVGSVGSNFLIARFTTTGALDTTFNGTGFVTTDFDGGDDAANSVAIKASGQILVGGRSNTTSGRAVIAAYTSAGVLDSNFGTGGKVVGDFSPSGRDDFLKIMIQFDGKIVGLGATGFPESQLVAQYNTNGTIDTTFGTNGITTVNIGSQMWLNGGAFLTDGRIFAVGLASGNFGTRMVTSRFNVNGTLDRTYGCNGVNFTSYGSVNPSVNTAYDAAVRSDNKVYVVGENQQQNYTFNSLSLTLYLNGSSRCTDYDFDRDGYTDLGVFRPSTGFWHRFSSENATFSGINFGLATDKLTPADFDGDGRTDYAVWREAPANQAAFYILQSNTNTVRTELFGQTGDKPNVVGDFDGDGKADPAVYRNAAFGNQSYFFYRGSLNNPNGNITFVPWGTNGDEGIRGDFDGDGKQDAAVYRPSNSTWFILKSSNNSLQVNNWGLNSDKRIEGDFDGDRKTDFAVFRPSNTTWYIQKSTDNQMIALQFGLTTDQLAPADYDGDGKTDIAVFRNGIWYLQQSSLGLGIGYYGTSGDTAIQSSFIP